MKKSRGRKTGIVLLCALPLLAPLLIYGVRKLRKEQPVIGINAPLLLVTRTPAQNLTAGMGGLTDLLSSKNQFAFATTSWHFAPNGTSDHKKWIRLEAQYDRRTRRLKPGKFGYKSPLVAEDVSLAEIEQAGRDGVFRDFRQYGW